MAMFIYAVSFLGVLVMVVHTRVFISVADMAWQLVELQGDGDIEGAIGFTVGYLASPGEV